jgi:hypothetical protein
LKRVDFIEYILVNNILKIRPFHPQNTGSTLFTTQILNSMLDIGSDIIVWFQIHIRCSRFKACRDVKKVLGKRI